MVYVASLSIPVKKALKDQVSQSNLVKICDQLTLDPDTTNMDVVFLGPKDLIGTKAVQLQHAVENRHPDICIIYLYEKDNERDLIDVEYKKQCKKIKPTVITEAFEEFVGPHKVRSGKQQVTSADFVVQGSDDEFEENFEDDFGDDLPGDDEIPEDTKVHLSKKQPAEQQPVPEMNIPPVDDSAFTGGLNLAEINAALAKEDSVDLGKGVNDLFTEEAVPAQDLYQGNPIPPQTDVNRPSGKLEEYLANLNNVEDWSIYKESLNKDSVVRELIVENSEYAGLVAMLDVLDKRIETVWRDSTLSATQKFEKIKEIGLEKATVRAATNSINVEKAISIISTIILSAKRTVDEKINSIDSAMQKISVDRETIADTSYIDKAIEERMKVQMELLETSRGILDLYKSVESLVSEEIKELDAKLPSANEFINNMVKPVGAQIFTPQNTAALANKLNKALQENRIVASEMETSVNNIIKIMFELCSKDEEIIRYQQQTINLFKANRVEDVVITNSLLKKSMNLFIGASNTGRSATAITWSGVLSRRNNCLLLDFTKTPKFREYGIEPVSLDDFMTRRIEQQFLCVESGRPLTSEELQEVVEQLRARLNYYSYVNVILEDTDINGLNQLSVDALCTYYITNCTSLSIACLETVFEKHKYDNIARKLVTIAAPVSPLMIADQLGADVSIVKLITLPNIDAIRACALRHDRPYEFNDVACIFEEAFR